jgi:SsrA-binding protein
VRGGHANLHGSFASLRGGELWLNNTHISPYPPAKQESYEPTRQRKLLLTRQQLDELARSVHSGYSIVVLSLGTSGSFIKVELGLGRGRKRYDKREHIKRREAKRDAAKALRQRG